MGIHPKIGITGLPRSGKSAVMEKVLSMLKEERERELSARNLSDTEIIGGICTEPILENGERLGYKVRDLVTGDEAEIAHKSIDSRLRVLGYGLNTAELERIAIPAIQHAVDNCEVIVIDEIGKFAVESEAFVNSVRNALEVDKPTLLTLHKKKSPSLVARHQTTRRWSHSRSDAGKSSCSPSVQDSQIDARNVLITLV